ncbi:SLATT domain-containing protein [Haloparvum sedimenti]|uniref:SLATT domain-containing protein n=1 Tax=Haloparvum sedimenti TaxID=1678448 RepID=UPI000F77C4CC|nr:SLATT domain-containing protein [Haloparvum sedimenti]
MSDHTDIRSRTEEVIANIKYVYKTHYLMAEWYERIDRILSILVAVGTGLLTASIIWEASTREILLTVALVVAILSWIDAVVSLGKKSEQHYTAADEYHDLYEDMKHFYNIDLENVDKRDQLQNRYDELISNRKAIKSSTPRTTNFWYDKLNHEEISKSIEQELENNRAAT